MSSSTSQSGGKKNFKDVNKMRLGRRAYDVYFYPFTNNEVEVAIRVLSEAELMVCEDNGKAMAKELLKEPSPAQITTYVGFHMIYEACYEVPTPGQDILQTKKFFGSIGDVADLPKLELQELLDLWTQTFEKNSNSDIFLKPEQFPELIEEIKKNSIFGMSLSIQTLKKLLLFSVNDDVRTSLKDSGLFSTPSNSQESRPNETQSNDTKPSKVAVKESRLEDKK